MKKAIILLGAMMLVFLSSCGTSYRVISDTDPSVDFSSYHTYSFTDWTDGNKKVITEMERERIRAAVARELEERGLKFVASGGDLQVSLTVYFREAREYFYYSPTSYNYIEQAITMDIFEGKSGKQVWHGAAIGEVEQDPARRAEQLPKIIARLVSRYPVERLS